MRSKLIVVLLLLLFTACIAQEKAPQPTLKEAEKVPEIQITSTEFNEGGIIPKEYTCDGKDISPPLSWGPLPENTKSIVLIVDDPDAPSGTFTHWIIFNIPPDVREMPAGVPQKERLEDGSVQGKNDFKRIGYNGPCPPRGPPHNYRFKVYALDTLLPLEPGATKKDVIEAMAGHILGRGELTGKYGR
jgi:hypothetical protein